MKRFAAGVLFLVAAIVAILLMTISPAPDEPRPEGKSLPAGAAGVSEAGEGEAATAEPQPEPPEQPEDLDAIKERVAASVERLPVRERLDLWMWNQGPQMSEEDYEKARTIYLRFLDNFARIKTASFDVEWRKVLKDGTEHLWMRESTIVEGLKYRRDCTWYEPDKPPRREVTICSGAEAVQWCDEKVAWRGRVRNRGFPAWYTYSHERAVIQDRHPHFLNPYTRCEVDDGTVGYSRLWNHKAGFEERFDTATGLIMEEGWTFQRVNGLWFPREQLHYWRDSEPVRIIISNVVLNEPVNEGLFDLSQEVQ